MKTSLSHLNQNGEAHMVDVSEKDITYREAVAIGFVKAGAAFLGAIQQGNVPKGMVFATARIAGIMAAKKTDELIPLCHSLQLDGIEIEFEIERDGVVIEATVTTHGRTGVEMEALTAVSLAALTIYDMGKAMDKSMTIGPIYLKKKSGGRSGYYVRKNL